MPNTSTKITADSLDDQRQKKYCDLCAAYTPKNSRRYLAAETLNQDARKVALAITCPTCAARIEQLAADIERHEETFERIRKTLLFLRYARDNASQEIDMTIPSPPRYMVIDGSGYDEDYGAPNWAIDETIKEQAAQARTARRPETATRPQNSAVI